MIALNAWVLHGGRTLPVVAMCKSNGVDSVVVMEAPGRPALIPLAVAVEAPSRSRPVLVCNNGERV